MNKRSPGFAPRLLVSNCVLDSSAMLALLLSEAGELEVADVVREPGVRMSAVNLCEVVSRLLDKGWPNDVARQRIAEVAFEPVAFDADAAYAASLLRPLTRQAGLSLGDRACLALAQRLGVPAITADRSWTTLGLPITVQVIR